MLNGLYHSYIIAASDADFFQSRTVVTFAKSSRATMTAMQCIIAIILAECRMAVKITAKLMNGQFFTSIKVGRGFIEIGYVGVQIELLHFLWHIG